MLRCGLSGQFKPMRSEICKLSARSRLLRSGFIGLMLFSSVIGLYLLGLFHLQQRWSPTLDLHPSPVQSLSRDQQSARSAGTLLTEDTLFYQTVSPRQETAAEKIASFTRNVLGYSEMPDQCKSKPGFSQLKTRFDMEMSNYDPNQFLPEYRNPCWRHPQSKQLHCLPFFYLAGFPKCGTTDLYTRMHFHPLLERTQKEPHWITRKRFGARSVDNYTRNYGILLRSRIKSNKTLSILGDGSASTAWDNYAWRDLPGNKRCTEPRIINADYLRHMNPNVKIIIILRNPTSRLYSSFVYFKTKTRDFSPESFHRYVLDNIAVFKNCRLNNSLRTCAYDRMSYTIQLHVGMYSVFVEDWLLRFPRDQLLFLRLEDVHDGSTIMPTVFNFLGVGVPDNATMKTIVNLEHRNVGTHTKKPMLKKTQVMLDDFYRSFKERLAQILQDRRFTWTDV